MYEVPSSYGCWRWYFPWITNNTLQNNWLSAISKLYITKQRKHEQRTNRPIACARILTVNLLQWQALFRQPNLVQRDIVKLPGVLKCSVRLADLNSPLKQMVFYAYRLSAVSQWIRSIAQTHYPKIYSPASSFKCHVELPWIV